MALIANPQVLVTFGQASLLGVIGMILLVRPRSQHFLQAPGVISLQHISKSSHGLDLRYRALALGIYHEVRDLRHRDRTALPVIGRRIGLTGQPTSIL